MSYSVSSTVTPLPEILYWSWTAGRPSTWPELLEWITAPALVKNWRLLDSRAADETGTNPLRAAAPTNPGGGLWPRATNWKPDAGGASVHWDGMLRLAPSPVGANVVGVDANRRLRAPQHLGDLRVGEVVDVAQDDDLALTPR